MKLKIIILALLTFIGVSAQDNPKDKLVETETRIINVMKDGEMVEKKIMVKTVETQDVKTDPAYKGTIDAPRVFPKAEVEKIIYIDSDNDPFYDSKSKIAYYKKDNKYYNFKINTYGFDILNSETDAIEGKARFTNNSDVYLMSMNGYNGIGYFEDDSFVIEFYDDNGVLIIENFESRKN
ncbi:hypothetical protein DFQ05_0850 [Winogradskyella wandonensis]|uniref:MORN repeat protein n=1 Tax=Winogradskyella wandonensis TaxID=1442586 RepID=A0A4R1KZ06_9FLAO|nr:hypothetical protein [Winogradskyella wandonensis]TCK69329.1 hypothetical protein DFQ05_0850 [Winogradskyella wandonensis]